MSASPAGDVSLSAVAHALAEPVLVLRSSLAGAEGAQGRAVARLGAILDGLVRLASADREAERGIVAIGPLLERAADGVEVRGGAADAAVEGDRALVEMLLVELLSNVREHGGAAAEVEVRAGAGAAWTLTVTDDGPGIPDVRPSPTEPFRRGPGVEPGAHAGVGLDVCRRVAAAHGGQLSLGTAANGRGLRVVVDVPPRW